jgi:hypothetical protein
MRNIVRLADKSHKPLQIKEIKQEMFLCPYPERPEGSIPFPKMRMQMKNASYI